VARHAYALMCHSQTRFRGPIIDSHTD